MKVLISFMGALAFLGTGGPTVVTEGKDALLTCVIMGSFSNDTVLWRRGNDDILAAGTNRVTSDRRFRVLHDESEFVFVLFLLLSNENKYQAKAKNLTELRNLRL